MTTETKTTSADLKAGVAHHAQAAPAFRAALLADPKPTVAAFLGADRSAHVANHGVEEAPDTPRVVLAGWNVTRCGAEQPFL